MENLPVKLTGDRRTSDVQHVLAELIGQKSEITRLTITRNTKISVASFFGSLHWLPCFHIILIVKHEVPYRSNTLMVKIDAPILWIGTETFRAMNYIFCFICWTFWFCQLHHFHKKLKIHKLWSHSVQSGTRRWQTNTGNISLVQFQGRSPSWERVSHSMDKVSPNRRELISRKITRGSSAIEYI